jgi:hypothetical protein
LAIILSRLRIFLDSFKYRQIDSAQNIPMPHWAAIAGKSIGGGSR